MRRPLYPEEINLKEFTPEGYKIIYISSYFFNTLEREMEKISRIPGSPSSFNSLVSLRDEPAKIEFRRLEKKDER